MTVSRIKKNDVVMAITGRNAGKTGKVLIVYPAVDRAVVEGLNMVKKAIRKSQDNPKGGISEKEASINMSKLMLYCPDCKKGIKIDRVKESGNTIRKCRKCGHLFEK